MHWLYPFCCAFTTATPRTQCEIRQVQFLCQIHANPRPARSLWWKDKRCTFPETTHTPMKGGWAFVFLVLQSRHLVTRCLIPYLLLSTRPSHQMYNHTEHIIYTIVNIVVFSFHYFSSGNIVIYVNSFQYYIYLKKCKIYL